MLNTSLPDSGSCPRLRSKSWNWPGLIPPPVAVQVTRETTVSSFSPNISIGLSSLRVAVVTFQPGTAVVCTEPIGWSLGRITRSRVVLASSRSFGTRNATTENPPPFASPWTVT